MRYKCMNKNMPDVNISCCTNVNCIYYLKCIDYVKDERVFMDC